MNFPKLHLRQFKQVCVYSPNESDMAVLHFMKYLYANIIDIITLLRCCHYILLLSYAGLS